jgi:hypothetical protein
MSKQNSDRRGLANRPPEASDRHLENGHASTKMQSEAYVKHIPFVVEMSLESTFLDTEVLLLTFLLGSVCVVQR